MQVARYKLQVFRKEEKAGIAALPKGARNDDVSQWQYFPYIFK